MRTKAIVLVAAALGGALAIHLVTRSRMSGGASNPPSSYVSDRGPDAGRRILRGKGWIGGEPVGQLTSGDTPHLLVFADPGNVRSHPFMHEVQAIAAEMPDVAVLWLTSADERPLQAWMDRLGFEGPALFGMEPDVVAHFGGTTLPMVRLIDTRGRIVARDLSSLKAHSLTGTRTPER